MPYIKQEEWEQYDKNFTTVWISEMKAKDSLSRLRLLFALSLVANIVLLVI
jgi:hypothetical protein